MCKLPAADEMSQLANSAFIDRAHPVRSFGTTRHLPPEALMHSRLIAVALFTVACSGSVPGTSEGLPESSGRVLSAQEQLELANAERRWNERRPASYTYEVRVRCICPREAGPWTEVTVVGDSVVNTKPLSSDPGDLEQVSGLIWPTVPGLFEKVRTARKEGNYHDVAVSYDDQFSYPVRIAFLCGPDFHDCGTVMEARNLKAVP